LPWPPTERLIEPLGSLVGQAVYQIGHIPLATGVEIDVDSLRPILIVCGAGLMFSLLMMMSGCDLGTSSEWIPPA
jgi:hypothetical protein